MREIVFIRQAGDEVGGVEKQIVKLARGLYEAGCFRPVLITTDKESDFGRIFSEEGLEVIPVAMSRGKIFSVGKILATAKEISDIISDRNVAVLQSHLFRESMIGRAVRRKNKNICHIFRPQTYVSSSTSGVWV